MRRYLFLFGVILGISKSVGQIELPDYSADAVGYEKTLRRLAASPRVEERIEAAAIIGARLEAVSHLAMLWTLLADGDQTVQGRASLAGAAVASDSQFTMSEATRFSAFLHSKITQEKTALLQRPVKEVDLWLMGCHAQALTSLYVWYPLVSRLEYSRWQQDTMLLLARRMAADRSAHTDQTDSMLLGLVLLMDEPGSALQALEDICSGLEKVQTQRVADTLRVLWRHPLFGKGRPMNDVLMKLISPRVAKSKARWLSETTDRFKRQEFEFYLNELQNGDAPRER
jgi:hypothetical protein